MQPNSNGQVVPVKDRLADWLVAAILVTANILAADGFLAQLNRILRASSWLDFQAYYLASALLNLGRPLYSKPVTAELAQTLGLAPMEYIYPSFFAALMRPLAALSFQSAGLVWLWSGLGALALTVLLLNKAFYLSTGKTMLLAIVAILMPEMLTSLFLGQTTLFLTLLFAAALAVAPRPAQGYKAFAAGLLIGVAAVIKVYPLVLIAVYLVHKRAKILAAIVVSILAAMLVSILYGGGTESVRAYFVEVLPEVGAMNLFPPNQSVVAAIQRLFQVYEMPTTIRGENVVITFIPLIHAPALGQALGIAAVLVILVTTFLVARRRLRLLPDRDAFIYNFGFVLSATLLVIPRTWDHYLPHLIIPLAIVGLYRPARTVPRILAALSCLFLALHSYWNVWMRGSPYSVLLLFGMLGTLSVWLALLWNPSMAKDK
ncbi:MAG: DUF2029 domain-containing protein [Anaerolineae bacterium]|nr:DUF2029 domain-containing protein [Anaerolineae bacterium]